MIHTRTMAPVFKTRVLNLQRALLALLYTHHKLVMGELRMASGDSKTKGSWQHGPAVPWTLGTHISPLLAGC